jgi:cytoplasmic iron level regulating protein YaaA (DUF328/UPF0246 family)
MATRVALVSCVKTKRKSAVAARDLYISQLFRGMRRYAEQNADTWFILSAEHGVLRPDQVIAPYERTLKTMPKPERLAWAERVRCQLLELLPAGAVIVVLAGDRYREGVVPFLQSRGFTVEVPMDGLKFGPQLHWLKEQGGDERSAH